MPRKVYGQKMAPLRSREALSRATRKASGANSGSQTEANSHCECSRGNSQDCQIQRVEERDSLRIPCSAESVRVVLIQIELDSTEFEFESLKDILKSLIEEIREV